LWSQTFWLRLLAAFIAAGRPTGIAAILPKQLD
jgi:hypothetical protein